MSYHTYWYVTYMQKHKKHILVCNGYFIDCMNSPYKCNNKDVMVICNNIIDTK